MKPSAVYFCKPESLERVYFPEAREAVERRLNMGEVLVTRDNWRDHRSLLLDVEAVVSSWGGPVLDEELLAAMPNLKVYFYGAGSITGLMTDAAWNRGIRITSAVSANAIPVAEFCLAQILFSLKHGWKYMQLAKSGQARWGGPKPVPGNYKSKVGIVSLGEIARHTCRLLKSFDLEVLVSSSYGSPELAEELRVSFTSVETIFRTCDVISIHLPANEKNRHRIGRKLLELMKPGSSLINTARGAVIHQDELIEFLKERPDVSACLDVTDPEPPELDSPLLELPNIILTPHIAGSLGGESCRLAEYIIAEIDRYLAGEPLRWEVTREMAASRA